MRIKDIILANYRLYKGINKISFQSDTERKNIYLISGENGFGKTTFLHSLLWCLYGRLMVDVDDSLKKDITSNGGYSTFLNRNLNAAARHYIEQVDLTTINRIKRTGYTNDDDEIKSNSTYFISITFTDTSIPSIPCQSLTVTRSYDFIHGTENINVLIDDHPNELSQTIGNDVFINDFILNKDIARFFFFDSERIVALADSNTAEGRRHLASAYSEVLGVKKYEDLKHNLEALRLKFRKRSSDIESRNKLNKLLEKQEQLLAEQTDITDTLQQKEKEISSLRLRDSELQEKLLREGQGMTMNEFNKQKMVLEAARNKDALIKSQLKEFIEFAPFAIAGKIMQEMVEEVTKDYNINKTSQSIASQNALVQSIQNELIQEVLPLVDKNSDIIQKTIMKVLSEFVKNGQIHEPLLLVNREMYNECQAVFGNLTSTYKVEFEHLADDNKKNKQVINRVQQRLASMQANESDEIIKQIRRRKENIEAAIAKIEDETHNLYAQQGVVFQALAVCKKQISELSKKVSIDDSDEKKDSLSEQLIGELERFLKTLKSEKKESLEHRLKSTMNCLMHKEDFIGRVSVNIVDDELNIELFSQSDTMIPKDTLSKGEQQLYATSLLKALVDESGIEFPVFIDSPLQKFDKSHSSKIISEFYPTISKQVVLFPLLHKELTETEMEIMKPLIKSTFLIKNEVDHSYFEEVAVDEFMNN